MSRPVRSGGGQTLAFAFTGQGAAYEGMGIALLAYAIFNETHESFDRELMGMGCEWPVLGKWPQETLPLIEIVFRANTTVS